MSQINDSEDSVAPNQSSANQEMEYVKISHADSKEDMFLDAPDELNNDYSKEPVTPTSEGNDVVLDENPTTMAKQVDKIDNGAYTNGDNDTDHLVKEIERLRSLLEQAAEEKEKLETKYKEEMEIFSREIYMKDKEIEGMNAKLMSSVAEVEVEKEAKSQQYEVVLERISVALGLVIDQGDLLGDSSGERIDLVEKSTLALIQKYNQFLSEVNQLGMCLAKAESDFGVHEFGTVFVAARDELFELRRKEALLVENIAFLENENRKFLEQVESEKATVEMLKSELEKTKTEVEQEKMRCANTKEKLSMAVTKGKGLVQMRDALKQSLADKTSELQKCLAELQEKSSALEASELHKEELLKSEVLLVSLQESLSEKALIIEALEHILSQIDVPEELQSVDIVGRARWLASERNYLKGVSLDYYSLKNTICAIDLPENVSFSDLDSRLAWLKESFYRSKDDINMLQNEISRTNEAARAEIDHLSATISIVQQEKHYIKEELDHLRKEYEEIVGKAHQISLDKDHLSASFAAELAEKDFIKKELDNLSTEYEKVVEKVHQLSSEKDQMIRILEEASGMTMADQEGIEEASYLPILIDRCFRKVKEQTSASSETTFVEAEQFEKLQCLFYVRNLELTLCKEVLEEDALVRSQLNDLSNQFKVTSQELFALKEEKDVLQKNLERSEDKSGLLREKLTMAVKKGKGLVQDRENFKLRIEEKNSEIEKLKLELQHEESTVANCRDQISTLSTDLERIPKLESDLVAMKEERDQLEKFLSESNSMLQRVIESIDRIVIPVDSASQEPVEKLNFLAGYIDDYLTTKTQTEQDLKELKEEANNLTVKLAEAEATMKSLEDALAVSKNDLSQLAEEKRSMEFDKNNIEIELQNALEEAHSQTNKFAEICEARKSIEEALSLAENKISVLSSEKAEVQGSRAASEMEMEKLKEEANNLTVKLAEAEATMKSLEDALAVSKNDLSQLSEEKRSMEFDKNNIEIELQNALEEAHSQTNKFAEICEARKSIEEALSLAENKISVLSSEKAEVQGSRAASEMEMEKLKEEANNLTVKLAEAEATMKSLEDALAVSKNDLSQLSEEKRSMEFDKNNIEIELQNALEEARSQTNKFAEICEARKSLEEALSLAENKISVLSSEKEEVQGSRAASEMETEKLKELKEEANNLTVKLAEAEATMKSLEDALAVSKNDLSQLAEEKRSMEFDKNNIEIELQNALEEARSQTNKFAEVCEARKSLEEALSLAENKISVLSSEKEEVQGSRAASEMEMEKLKELKEEANNLTVKLAEAEATMKSLEDALAVSKNELSQLAEEKRSMEFDKNNIEIELQNALEEARSQTNKFAEICEARKSLEEALSLAENKILVLSSEKEEVQGSRAASEMEMEKLREEVSIQTNRLTEAYTTIKSLESSLSQAEVTVASLTEQNNNSQVEITNLENELKKLKDETEIQARELADADITVKSLEDALIKAEKDFSALQTEKRTADQEISTLNSKLTVCMEELAGSKESSASRSIELIGHLNNIQMLAKDQSLLLTMKQCFDRNLEHLNDVDLVVKNTRDHLFDKGLELLQDYPLMEDVAHLAGCFSDDIDNNVNIGMENGEENVIYADDVSSCVRKVEEGFQLRSKILADRFEAFSKFLDQSIAALLKKLHATKDEVKSMVENMESLKQNVKDLEMHEQEKEKTMAMLQKDVEILFSACTDAIGDLHFEVDGTLTELSSLPGLEKLNHGLHPEAGEFVGHDMAQQETCGNTCAQTGEKLLTATRKVQSLVKFFEATSKAVATIVYDLQKELEDAERASKKVIEERDVYQSRIFKLESDVEALVDSCRELRLKLDDYEAKGDIWKEKEAEHLSLYNNLLMKEKEAEEPLLSASQLRTLLDKLSAIEIPLVESEDLEPQSSNDVKKLFSIIDNFTELHNQINILSYEKEELQSTLSRQSFEIEHLKEEIEMHVRNKPELEMMKMELSDAAFGLEKIIEGLGGKEFIGGQNSFGMRALFPVLEKQLNALLLEAESSKSRAQELGAKLLGSQNTVDELSSKVKLLEDSLQGRSVQPENVQERSIFEAPSASIGSEISEIEDAGSHGKKTISPVPSAAQMRITRKGSGDHLALNIDSESDRLINSEETDEDKGRLFKSLNTTGLIPKQGKLIADRVDGVWVSGGRVLSSRPRARLGLIAYCLLLHIWLLGTIVV